MAKEDINKSKTRILVVDDHAIVRQGLKRLVEAECDLMVSAEAENDIQALEILDRQQFDLAIVDIALEAADGLELTKKMKLRYPNLIVLVLSMHDEFHYAQPALRAGAAGYVTKAEAAEKIIIAIRWVLSGKTYVSNSQAVTPTSDTEFTN